MGASRVTRRARWRYAGCGLGCWIPRASSTGIPLPEMTRIADLRKSYELGELTSATRSLQPPSSNFRQWFKGSP